MDANIGFAYCEFFDHFVDAAAVDSDPVTWPEPVVNEWRNAFKAWDSQVSSCP
jgi:hypothetical protein